MLLPACEPGVVAAVAALSIGLACDGVGGSLGEALCRRGGAARDDSRDPTAESLREDPGGSGGSPFSCGSGSWPWGGSDDPGLSMWSRSFTTSLRTYANRFATTQDRLTEIH